MGARILSFFRPAPAARGDWSNQELAEFYRVESALAQAGILSVTERGLSDEGEPWFVFCRSDTNDVIVHFARIAGMYVIASDAYDAVLRGPDFRALINDVARRYPLVLPVQRSGAGSGKVLLHPAALVTALIATAFFKIGGGEAVAAEFEADGVAAAETDPQALGPAALKAQPPLPRPANDVEPFTERHAAMVMSAVAIASAMAVIPVDWLAPETVDLSRLLGLDRDEGSILNARRTGSEPIAFEAASLGHRDFAHEAGSALTYAAVGGSGAVGSPGRDLVSDGATASISGPDATATPVADAAAFASRDAGSEEARGAAARSDVVVETAAPEDLVFDSLVVLAGHKRPFSSPDAPGESVRGPSTEAGSDDAPSLAGQRPQTLAFRLVADELAEVQARVTIAEGRSTERLDQALSLVFAELGDDFFETLRLDLGGSERTEPGGEPMRSETVRTLEPVVNLIEPVLERSTADLRDLAPPSLTIPAVLPASQPATPVATADARPAPRAAEARAARYDDIAHKAIETFMQETSGYRVMASGQNVIIYDTDTSQTGRNDYGVRSWTMDDGSTISIIGVLPDQVLHLV